MEKVLNKYIYITFSLILLNGILNAQSVGLGFSGFFAGYSQQDFSSNAINDYVSKQNSAIDPSHLFFTDQINFKQVTGYRIGANIFRANFGDVFITAKGYYQFLRELHNVSAQMSTGFIQENYQLSMNHWGVGIDFGMNLFWIIDWKIVEGNLTFFNSNFSQEEFVNNVSQGVNNFNSGKNKMGYFLGSGLILKIVPDYFSVEGTLGYNFIKIDQISNSSGSTIPSLSKNPAIEKGGISTTVQINVGFPL